MRKYFMELFAMGFVDSEGNLVEENVLRDAQRTAVLTAKIMKEKMDNTWEMESHLNRIFCAWLIYSDKNFSRSITYVIGREAACVEERLWMVGEALDDDEFCDYLSEYLMALIVEVANATRDQIIDNFISESNTLFLAHRYTTTILIKNNLHLSLFLNLI